MSSLHVFEASGRVVQVGFHLSEDRCHPHSAALGSCWIETTIWPQTWPTWYAALLMSYSIAAWPGGILSMLLVPCEKMNCGALLTSSCRVVWLYIKITNHSSTLIAYWTALTVALINLVLPTTTMQWVHLSFWNCTLNPVVIYTHSLVPIHNYQYQCELLNALIDRKTAIYHATIQHLLALFRKQCPLVAQAWWQ